ncbi:hypothetical protein [Nesterenkonia alba]|uniref:hypothetical protein n=1 Tax=Nesterenkonia alba TaxID=515814 RepID=UPI0003B35314|nr:hypothetical protein [Nesterenkonia alba]
MSRVVSAARLHVLQRNNIVTQVPLIFGIAYTISVLIVLLIHVQGASVLVGPGTSGATGAVHGAVIGAAAVSSMMLAAYSLPHALSLSYSRRTFLLGTYVVFFITAALIGVLFGIAAALEEAFDGYGIGHYSVAVPYLTGTAGAFEVAAFSTALALCAMASAFLIPMLYRRVGLMRLWAITGAVLVVLLLLVAWATITDGWAAVGQWLLDQNGFTWAGWLVAATGVATVANWLTIRRIPAE